MARQRRTDPPARRHIVEEQSPIMETYCGQWAGTERVDAEDMCLIQLSRCNAQWLGRLEVRGENAIARQFMTGRRWFRGVSRCSSLRTHGGPNLGPEPIWHEGKIAVPQCKRCCYDLPNLAQPLPIRTTRVV